MHDHVAVEYWGIAGAEGALARDATTGSFSESRTKYCHCCVWRLIHSAAVRTNNTYKALRIVSPGYDLLYTVWCSHEHEVYDMKVRRNDPP